MSKNIKSLFYQMLSSEIITLYIYKIYTRKVLKNYVTWRLQYFAWYLLLHNYWWTTLFISKVAWNETLLFRNSKFTDKTSLYFTLKYFHFVFVKLNQLWYWIRNKWLKSSFNDIKNLWPNSKIHILLRKIYWNIHSNYFWFKNMCDAFKDI